MVFTSILILIVAKALPSINKNLSSNYFTRISTILFLYAGVLNLNTFYIQSIGSGIGIYSGLFQITQVSVLIESFLLFISSLILILISLYISIELQSFGLYVLSTLYRDSESSTKAGLTNFESIFSIISTSNSITYSDLPLLSNNIIALSYDMAIQGLNIGLLLNKPSFKFKILNSSKERDKFKLGNLKFHTASILFSSSSTTTATTSTTTATTSTTTTATTSTTTTTTQDTIPTAYSNLTSDIQAQLDTRRRKLLGETEQEQDRNLDQNTNLIEQHPELEVTDSITLILNGNNNNASPILRALDQASLNDPSSSEIGLFDSVRYVTSYIRLLHNTNPNLINDVRLSEIFSPFEENSTVKTQDFLNHLKALYLKDPEFFKNLFKINSRLITRASSFNSSATSSSISDNSIASTSSISDNSIASIISSASSSSEPRLLGEFGEMTLNQIVNRINDFGFDTFISGVTIHPLPMIGYTVTYGLLLRNFLNYVHNRPYPANLTPSGPLKEQRLRRRELAYFSWMIGPFMLLGSKWVGLSLKDIFSIRVYTSPVSGNSEGSGPNIVKYGFLFITSLNNLNNKNIWPNWMNFRNKLPFWFKIIILLILIILLIIIFLLLLYIYCNNIPLFNRIVFCYFFLGLSYGVISKILLLIFVHLFRSKK